MHYLVICSIMLFLLCIHAKAEEWSDDQGIQFYTEKLITAYRPQARDTIALLLDLMKKGKLPILYPTVPDIGERFGDRYFTPLNFNTMQITANPTNDIVIIENFDNVIEPGSGDDTVELITAGDNTLEGRLGNRRDRTLFVFKKNWGHDFINKGCIGITNEGLKDVNGKSFWLDKGFTTTTFLIFGPGIYPEDVIWEEPYKITNTVTGDTIKFTKDSWCSNIIFYEEGKMKPFSWLDFYNRL